MSLSNIIALEEDVLSFEGKVTSVALTDNGGTITGRGNASVYGLIYLTYNISVNPSSPGRGAMVGRATAIAEDGTEATAVLSGVWDRQGHLAKIYCFDDISDGHIHLAVVSINFKDESLRVDFSRVKR